MMLVQVGFQMGEKLIPGELNMKYKTLHLLGGIGEYLYNYRVGMVFLK